MNLRSYLQNRFIKLPWVEKLVECKEWKREQSMQIVVFEKITSHEPKKSIEANEGVFDKSI